SLDDVMGEVLPYLRDAVIVAHNAAFDLGFLQRALEQCGYAPFNGRVLDTLDMLRMVFPGLSTLRLATVSASFELEHDRPHSADSDAEATALIWQQCLEKLEQLPLITLQRLVHIFDNGLPVMQDLLWFLQELLQKRELQTSLD